MCRYILHLEKAGEFERLAAIAIKVMKPTVLRRLKIAEAEQPLLCALARACSATMAACMAQVDMACTMRMQAAHEVSGPSGPRCLRTAGAGHQQPGLVMR